MAFPVNNPLNGQVFGAHPWSAPIAPVKEVTPEVMEDMLLRASKHIENQRRELEFLRPKAEAYELVKQLLGMLKERVSGYGETEPSMQSMIEELVKRRQEEKLEALVNGNP